MRSPALRGFGIAAVVWGVILLAQGLSITGFAVLGGLESGAVKVIGVCLLLGGIALLSFDRGASSLLERSVGSATETKVVISNIALERTRKDKTIKAMLPKFIKEIEMIRANPLARPKEKIGEFLVSPHGRNPARVAWHYDQNTRTLYIDDLRYHITEKDYDNKWNRKARQGEIDLETYRNGGYSAFSDVA